MKISKKIVILITLTFIIGVFGAKVITGLYLTKDWGKNNTEVINCNGKDYIKLKDLEGNTFIFEDSKDNQNLKTKEITFKEKELGIKSIARVKTDSKVLIYITKNDVMTNIELGNMVKCYGNDNITVSNNYDFVSDSNKFCKLEVDLNLIYKFIECR